MNSYGRLPLKMILIAISIICLGGIVIADDDCDGIYSTRTDHIVNSKPISVFAGDLDNDGNQDIAVACYFREFMSYIFNNGDGTYTWPVWGIVPYYTEWVDGADFDGDGFIDIVTANSDDPNVSVLINTGERAFEIRVDYTTYGNCRSVCAADFNNDGYPDIVAANYWSNMISILLNEGDGTFSHYVPYSLTGNPRGVFAADLNSDNAKEIITANLDQGTVSIFINDGSGVFTLSSTRPVGNEPFMVYAADLDNNETIDLITPNSGDSTISILFNHGNVTFSSPVQYTVGHAPVYVRAVDIDEDGDNDLITANSDDNTVTTLINNGDGEFNHSTINETNVNPYGIADADFDGDSHVDIVVATFMTNYVTILKNADALPFTGLLTGNIHNNLGEPIGDVSIRLLGEALTTSTDSLGNFHLDSLCCKTYNILLSHDNYCDTTLTDVRISPDDTTVIDLSLNYRAIGGFVEDVEASPIESVLVEITDLEMSTYTDSTGWYFFGCVDFGEYDIAFYHSHFVDTSVSENEVILNDTLEVDMIMQPRGFITGTISDSLMQPIEGIEISIAGVTMDSSDINGYYLLEYLNSGEYDILFASQYYYDTTLTNIAVTPGDTTYLDLIMVKRPDIEIWYGPVSGDPAEVIIDDEVAVDVYIRTSGPVQIENARLVLGADTQYISGLLSMEEGELFYPFNAMAQAEFSSALGSPPNQAGWSSQYLEASDSMAYSPWFNFTEPTEVARFIVSTTSDTTVVGDTILCLNAGVDNNGDTSRVEGFSSIEYSIKQHFCSFNFSDKYRYLPGDANMASNTWPPNVVGGDVTYLVNYFRGLSLPCMLGGFYAPADVSGDCLVVGSDVTVLVNYFRGRGNISYCPDYQPQWLTSQDLPAIAPTHWPGCEQ